MKGFKTLIVAALMAVVPTLLTFLAGIDWTQYVSPTIAPWIAAAIMAAMRMITTTPVGKTDA